MLGAHAFLQCPLEALAELQALRKVWLFRTPIHIAGQSYVLPISRVGRLAIPLRQKVDHVTSELEPFVLKVVASTRLEVRVGSKTSCETIALTSSHIAQELAFSPGLSVSYPDEFGPAVDADGRARPGHEKDCNQIRDLHIDADALYADSLKCARLKLLFLALLAVPMEFRREFIITHALDLLRSSSR